MKVRIGVGAGTGDAATLATVADAIGRLGLDSIWLSEVLTGGGIDPLVGLAWAAAAQPQLKIGTTLLFPGRNPLRLAKALASLDRLSGGRLLVTAVPGLTQRPEREAIGVPPTRRGSALDDVLPLVRRLWAGETVDWEGEGVRLDGVTLTPRPVQDPLEVWLGGTAPAALRRCGRLGDGWLPSLCPPDAAEAGREVIRREAETCGREISEEHYGVSIGYAHRPLDPEQSAALARRGGGVDPALVVPVGWEALRSLVVGYRDRGFSKFVLRPLAAPMDWNVELEALADAVGDLQT